MIYISRALKGSSDLSAARELYERVAGMVEGLGQDAYVPHKATDPEGNPTIPPGEVFRTDVDNILASKGVIAFLNEPSLGVGTEIAICIHESIPVFGFPAMNPRPPDAIPRWIDPVSLAQVNACISTAPFEAPPEQPRRASQGSPRPVAHGLNAGRRLATIAHRSES